ncbi:MAG TPA: hypothetical protein VF039_04900 [Longimicrobiales bacterium]
MTFPRFGRLAAMMMLAFAVASCEHAETPTDVAPAEFSGEPQELLGIGDLLGGLTGSTTTIRAIDQYGTIRTYTLVREPVLTNVIGTVVQTVDGLLASVTRLIGLDGGTLSLLGHRLVVPANAVDQPTTFTLGVLLSGNTRVDLTAYAPGNSGRIDVGAAGFDRPVRLDMSYERATNVRDPRDLVIIRLNPAGMGALHEVVPATVDTRNERVTTWLEHFSGYAMAM